MNQLVAYVDMNAYFASVEQQTNPNLRRKPIVVGGRPGTRSVVTTASYEARKFGVKTGMSTTEALNHCPMLTVVPPDYGKYQDHTRRLAELANAVSPSVEICSIDELAIDVSHLVIPDSPEKSCRQLRHFVDEFKATIANELGRFITASVGIATSPIHAKIAGDLRKPNGLFMIAPTAGWARAALIAGMPSQTWIGLRHELPLEAVPGIGTRLSATLRLAGYFTLDALANAEEGELIFRFGVLGTWLSRMARGGTTRAIHSFQSQAVEQSMSHQTTLPRDLPLIDTRSIFFTLADRVGARLRRANVVGHTITVGFGRTHASGWYVTNRLHTPIGDGLNLFRAGWRRIEARWGDAPLFIRRPMIGIAGLMSADRYPPSLFPEDERRESLTAITHVLRSTYGNQIIQPATVLTANVDHVPDGRRARFTSLAQA